MLGQLGLQTINHDEMEVSGEEDWTAYQAKYLSQARTSYLGEGIPESNDYHT